MLVHHLVLQRKLRGPVTEESDDLGSRNNGGMCLNQKILQMHQRIAIEEEGERRYFPTDAGVARSASCTTHQRCDLEAGEGYQRLINTTTLQSRMGRGAECSPPVPYHRNSAYIQIPRALLSYLDYPPLKYFNGKHCSQPKIFVFFWKKLLPWLQS